MSVKNIGEHIKHFVANNLNDFTVQWFTMYTNAGWWLQSCSVNCM